MADVFIVNAGTIKAGQLALTFGARFLDMFRAQQFFRVEWTSPTYRKEKFLWWTTLEEGEKIVFELRGKPAFCDAILNHLQHRSLYLRNGATVEPSIMEGTVARVS